MKNRSSWGVACLAAASLAACSTTSMYKVQSEAGFQSSQIHKILVISMSKRPDVRQTVENEFVKEFKKHGAEAISSYALLPSTIPLEKSHIAPIAKAQGFDSVLVSRLLGVQKIDPNIRNEEFDASEAAADAELKNSFKAIVASPEYASDYQMAVVTANLYSVAAEKKVWSATTQTLVSQDLPTHIRDYVRVVLKNLYQ